MLSDVFDLDESCAFSMRDKRHALGVEWVLKQATLGLACPAPANVLWGSAGHTEWRQGCGLSLALALAHTGHAFTFFSPFLGWIGVFLTGSDTSANALFGALQATTAQQLGLPQVLTVAANTTGGVTGKMISPQSIAIACAAVGLAGKESDLFRFTVKHSLIFAVIIGIITTLQAYVFTWMIPGH